MGPVVFRPHNGLSGDWVCSGCYGEGTFASYLARLLAGEIELNGAPVKSMFRYEEV